MKYIIRLYVDNSVFTVVATENEKITFGSGAKDNCNVPMFKSRQLTVRISKEQLVATAKGMADFNKGSILKGERTRISTDNQISMLWGDYFGYANETYELPYDGVITIGRKSYNDIVIDSKYISKTHMTIICQEGYVRVEDGYQGAKSTNGIYYNCNRADIAPLNSGDVLDIYNFRIHLKNNVLLFENVGCCLQINNYVTNKISIKEIEQEKHLIYRRAPRMRKALPDKEIVLAKAPAPRGYFHKNRGMLTSLISSGAMMAATVAYAGVFSPALIAARAAGMAAPLASAAMYGSSNKSGKKAAEKAKKEFEQKYGAYIENQYAIISKVAQQQRAIIKEENPEPGQWITTVNELHPNLWERRPSNSDFLNIRIGMGYEPICVKIKAPSDSNTFQVEDDESQAVINQLIESTRIVDDIPSRINLFEHKTVGVVGKRKNVVDLVKNMLISLTASHFYDDVKIVGIFDEEEAAIWNSMRWLPHVWDGEKQRRFLAFDQKNAERLSDTFYEIIQNRLNDREHQYIQNQQSHYVFVLGSYKYMAKSKLLGELVKNAGEVGVSTIFAYNLEANEKLSSRYQMSYLPNQCEYVIDTEGEHGSPSAFEFQRQNRGFMFTLDKPIDDGSFEMFCRTLSAVRVVGGAEKMELPAGISFLEGMGVKNANDIDIWGRWSDDKREQQLRGSIGITADGKNLSIDIGDFTQPPISLVAGMAGSGKSELLKTWILSMAVNNSPEDLEFVIIDYKGGSMAVSVEELPHVVGKITDIESGDIMRPLAALSYEIQRRERIFAEVGVVEYKDYIKKLRGGEVSEPLPMMVIMCDEFAELKQQHREFMSELVAIARKGRSLGIRLVLATQSPAGVVDQDLFDNSRFQICLKVQNSAASKSMIDRPDAARLTQNGRAYVRAGSDELFALIQSYWTGAPYFGNQKASVGNQIRVVNMSGERIKTVHEEKTRFKSEIDELTVVIREINRIAREHGIVRGKCPWKEELPKHLSINDIKGIGGFDGADWRQGIEWLKIPIGMYDIPEKQEQGIQYINFDTEGHYGIYGLPGTGKKTLLKTIAAQIGMYYSPKDVNMFILDLGNQTMRMFDNMPHVAGIAFGGEEDKIKKISEIIENTIFERKKMFARNGIGNLRNYREHIADDMPAIFLLVDNLTALFEVCPAFEELIYRIGNEGAGYGIYLVYTATNNNGIRYKLTQNIYSRIAFEMADKSNYIDVLGKSVPPEKLRKIKGRAYSNGNTAPVIFQAAVYGEGQTDMQWQEWFKGKTELMKKYWDGPNIGKIKTLPEHIRVKDVICDYKKRNVIPIGMDSIDVETAYLDFEKGCGALVIGDDISKRTSIIRSIVSVISDSAFNQKILVIDDSNKSLEEIENICDGYVKIDNNRDLDEFLNKLIQALVVREGCDNLEEFSQICVIVSNIKELVDMVDAGEDIDDKVYKKLHAIIKNAHGLGMIMIAGANADDIRELHLINSVISRLVQCKNAIAVDGKPGNHSFFNLQGLSMEARKADIDVGDAMLYSKDNVRKIKLLS